MNVSLPLACVVLSASALLLSTACDPPPPQAGAASSSSASTSSQHAASSASTTTSAPPPPGPADPSAARDAREARVWALLDSGSQAAALPVVATEPGVPFDPDLPRVLGSGRPDVPRVRMGKPVVRGALAPEVVFRILRQVMGNIRLCYEKALRDDPNSHGELKARIVIDSQGKTTSVDVTVKPTLSTRLAQCVSNALRPTSFPSPDNGIAIAEIPYTFHPSQSFDPKAK